MTELIYHKTDNLNGISPFDNAIIKLVAKKQIRIASPYINIYYLQKIIKLADNWKLLTDINELFASVKLKGHNQKLIDFIEKNKSKIKHFPSLHAKTIISDTQIFLGSSNFTNNGIFSNNELSVVITDADKITELTKWFDDWWLKSDFISYKQLKAIIKSNKTDDKKTKFVSNAPLISTKPVNIPTKSKTNQEILPITEIEIKNYLKKWNNRNWEFGFFMLINKAIKLSSLKSDSNYLALTLTKSKQITVQINNRIILKSHTKGKKKSIGFILPLEFESQIKSYKNIDKEMEYFTSHKKEKQSLLIHFLYENIDKIDKTILQLWERAINNELKRKFKSPYKKYHQDIIYDIATDNIKLKNIFNDYE